MVLDRDAILRDLREHVVDVAFTKVNGEDRIMRCSLRKDILPPNYALTEEAKEREFHQKNPDVISAWDVQKGGWRSFRIESVKYVNAVDGY